MRPECLPSVGSPVVVTKRSPEGGVRPHDQDHRKAGTPRQDSCVAKRMLDSDKPLDGNSCKAAYGRTTDSQVNPDPERTDVEVKTPDLIV